MVHMNLGTGFTRPLGPPEHGIEKRHMKACKQDGWEKAGVFSLGTRLPACQVHGVHCHELIPARGNHSHSQHPVGAQHLAKDRNSLERVKGRPA